jgi:signal transduction histidine kinase
MAEHALALVALTAGLAPAVTFARLRGARRRRSLNRALHELRRPLQVLALSERERPAGQLSVALEALEALDREINREPRPPAAPVDLRALTEHAVERWRLPAELANRALELEWEADRSVVVCDPAAISGALDNLIANSLEHGRGPITIEGRLTRGRLQVRVADAGAAAAVHLRPGSSGRRGHGTAIVAAVAARHGGRFARGERSSVLELPLSR